MRVEVLGCSGGLGKNLRTTSLLIEDDILIDCGTGVGDLSVSAMGKLRHVFLTHSHLDHIVALPLLVDTVFEQLKTQPLTLHCRPETYDSIMSHIFNWEIWPNFFELPEPNAPAIRYEALNPGELCEIGDKKIEMIAVNHTVPSGAYCIQNGKSTIAFSGDTTNNDVFWEALNQHERLDLLIVECAFSEKDRELGMAAKHYCPSILAEDIHKLKHSPAIGISHLHPGSEARIFNELRELLPNRKLHRLHSGDVFDL